MTKELGKDIAGGGFLPTIPQDMEELLKGGGGLLANGWEGLKLSDAAKPMADQVEKPADDLKRSYARLYSGRGGPADAAAVVEDLLDQTLRRGMFFTVQGTSMDQHLPYFLERSGQNGFMIYIAKMVEAGHKLAAKPPKKTKAKKK